VNPGGPLAGRTVAVTRAREQSDALTAALAALGADVVVAPAIELTDPPSWQPLDEALRRLATFDWILWTSANAVERLRARLELLGLSPQVLPRLPARSLALGPATARALADAGLTAETVALDYRAEGVLAALADEPLEGRAIWLPRALEARDVVPETLRARGAEVVVTPVYAARPSPEGVAPARDALAAGRLDAVTFTSGAIARAFVAALDGASLENVVRASIGPVTSDALRALGLAPQVEAREATVPALVAALVEHYAGPISEDAP
jgi:uroporphyrinogen III methyltransferase/synthase